MSKIVAYSRISHHGLTNSLSGATIPSTNDHTDGSWLITDIYDREILINTGNGSLQYRAGNNIYNSVISSGSTIKNVILPIGNWDMRTSTGVNDITLTSNIPTTAKILSVDAIIYSEGFPYVNQQFSYTMIEGDSSFSPLFLISTNAFSLPYSFVIGIRVGVLNNWFRVRADGPGNTSFTTTGFNRGYITVQYMD